MTPRGVAVFAVTAGIALVLASCILVVSPTTYGDQCHFTGESTQCGACIANSCRADVNACCADDACAGTLKTVETCADRRDPSCGAIPGDPSPLAKCVTDRCGPVCQTLSGTSQTACKEPPLGAGAACACTFGDAPNDFVCDAAAYPETLCCAPQGWPAVGLECTCSAVSCNPSTDGCFCDLVTTVPERRECSGLTCCAADDGCTCRAKACFAFERQVPKCDRAALGCKVGQVRVDSCSMR